jgi:hypothetical protein
LDIVTYVEALASIVVDLSRQSDHVRAVGTADAAGIGVDTLVNVECVIRSPFADMMTGGASGIGFWAGTAMICCSAGPEGDFLDGGDGVDWLEGGAGLDVMTGGAGGDRFVFRTGDLGSTVPGSCDVIRDYSYASGDRIRLDLTDANSTLAGTQNFAFIGTGAFTGLAGQLRYEQANGNTFVSAGTDGDGVADFAIQVDGLHALRSADFIL